MDDAISWLHRKYIGPNSTRLYSDVDSGNKIQNKHISIVRVFKFSIPLIETLSSLIYVVLSRVIKVYQ